MRYRLPRKCPLEMSDRDQNHRRSSANSMMDTTSELFRRKASHRRLDRRVTLRPSGRMMTMLQFAGPCIPGRPGSFSRGFHGSVSKSQGCITGERDPALFDSDIRSRLTSQEHAVHERGKRESTYIFPQSMTRSARTLQCSSCRRRMVRPTAHLMTRQTFTHCHQ